MTKEDAGAARNTAAPIARRYCPSVRRASLFQPCREFLAIDLSLIERRIEIARRDGVCLQAVLGPIGRHSARQVLHRALGCRIGRDARAEPIHSAPMRC